MESNSATADRVQNRNRPLFPHQSVSNWNLIAARQRMTRHRRPDGGVNRSRRRPHWGMEAIPAPPLHSSGTRSADAVRAGLDHQDLHRAAARGRWTLMAAFLSGWKADKPRDTAYEYSNLGGLLPVPATPWRTRHPGRGHRPRLARRRAARAHRVQPRRRDLRLQQLALAGSGQGKRLRGAGERGGGRRGPGAASAGTGDPGRGHVPDAPGRGVADAGAAPAARGHLCAPPPCILGAPFHGLSRLCGDDPLRALR
jgi:hypothetical protein